MLYAYAASPLALSHDGYATSGGTSTGVYQPSFHSPWLAAFEVIYKQFASLQTEVKSTKLYRDNGQLFHSDKLESTNLVYFIQRGDGEVKVVRAGIDGVNAYHILKEHLVPEINAVVIECKVPTKYLRQYEKCYLNSEYGALEFLGNHHPSHMARVIASSILLDRYPPNLSEIEMAEHRIRLTKRANKLGISFA